ncbi:MAG TPA: FtsX-like permease family protein, partial [Blastocatellia bacterium]|nr:FtsX-like permease family protein [Blastocatellia bacterium]
VAKNGKYLSLGENPIPMVYVSLLQSYESSVTLVTRTHNDPKAVITSIHAESNHLDPNLPLYDVKPLKAQLDLPLLPTRVAAGLLGGFGLLALSLATIGIYGVVSYAARQRTREIGIRIALGAARGDVLRLIVRQGMVVVAFGLALGVLGAVATTRFLSGILYGVSPTDALTFGLVSLSLALAALVACYLPAKRATKLEPMTALRSD